MSSAEPMLAATLLELVHERALYAPTDLLESDEISQNGTGDSAKLDQMDRVTPSLSQQAILVLTMIDALASLSLNLLEEWLPIAAQLVNKIHSGPMREHCKHHLWETLVGGDMDPERSQICVAWWTTQGGREALLYGAPVDQSHDEPLMSGALPADTAKL